MVAAVQGLLLDVGALELVLRVVVVHVSATLLFGSPFIQLMAMQTGKHMWLSCGYCCCCMLRADATNTGPDVG